MKQTLTQTKNYLLRQENRYLWYTLFLPVYLLAFAVVERVLPAEVCQPVHIPLDDKIPLLEGFVVPYILWMPMILAMGVLLIWKDHEAYKRFWTYFGVSCIGALALYLLFPNRQDLRPPEMPRDNLFTWILSIVYASDTNTNVCPSIHVIGSFAVCFAAWDAKCLRKFWIQAGIWTAAFVIAISTIFVRQHSVLDLMLAVPYSFGVYLIVYKLVFRTHTK